MTKESKERDDLRRLLERQYRSPNSIRIPRRRPQLGGHNRPDFAEVIAGSRIETPLDYLLLKMPKGVQKIVEKHLPWLPGKGYYAAKKNFK